VCCDKIVDFVDYFRLTGVEVEKKSCCYERTFAFMNIDNEHVLAVNHE
jgi:hypothetical protein